MIKGQHLLIGLSVALVLGTGLYVDRDFYAGLFKDPWKVSGVPASGPGANMLNGKLAATKPLKECDFNITEAPKNNPVILNEIAWMGTEESASHEWIELKNTGPETADVGNWQLLNQNGKIKIVLASGANISPSGFYLLERGGADFLPGVKADKFFAAAITNSGERLRLFDDNCLFIDEAAGNLGAKGSWPAGNNDTKQTMERNTETLAWYTSASPGGTPKKENDPAPKPTAVWPNTTTNKTTIPSQPAPLPTRGNINHIVISQIQITGGADKTSDDFVELYNPTGMRFNLKGYRLVKRTQTGSSDTLVKSWTTDTFIPAYGFYLWANSGYNAIAVSPDTTTVENISENNGVAIRSGPNDTGTIMDSVAWGSSSNAFAENSAFSKNPGAGQSLLRKSWRSGCVTASFDVSTGNGCDTGVNASDFELAPASRPRNSLSR